MTTQTYNQNDSSFQSQSSSQSRPDCTSRLARAYREIGIKSGATLQTVEKRIRKLISDNHPDKFQTPQIKERQTEWLKTLNAHRELLIGHFREEHPNAQDKCFCCDDQKTQVIRTTNAKAASAGKTTPSPSSDISKELAKQLDALVSPFKSTKDARRRKLVAMHVMGDRVLFFDPELNPACSYAAELGAPGSVVPADALLPERRYEDHGMHSIEKRFVQDLFYGGKAYAMIPIAFKLAV